eukprot:scaffold282915_cov28-Tisochrysis_lutea.AAC.3
MADDDSCVESTSAPQLRLKPLALDGREWVSPQPPRGGHSQHERRQEDPAAHHFHPPRPSRGRNAEFDNKPRRAAASPGLQPPPRQIRCGRILAVLRACWTVPMPSHPQRAGPDGTKRETPPVLTPCGIGRIPCQVLVGRIRRGALHESAPRPRWHCFR